MHCTNFDHLPNSPKTGPPQKPFTIMTQDLICMIALENAKLITNLFAAVLRVLWLQRLINNMIDEDF